MNMQADKFGDPLTSNLLTWEVLAHFTGEAKQSKTTNSLLECITAVFNCS